PLGGTAGRMGAATNQGAEEGYRMARDGRISARNSALWSECLPTAKKRPVGTLCPNWPFVCRGDWIRTSGPLNPIQGATTPKPLVDNRVTPNPSSACTNACTRNRNVSKALTLEDLAAALSRLSPGDRAKLAAMLSETMQAPILQ